MPVIFLPISEVTDHILDQVSYQVVDSVLMELGLYGAFKDSIYIYTDYMDGSITHDANNDINLSRDRCNVKVEHSVNPNESKWNNVLTFRHTQAYGTFGSDKRSFFPIFRDDVADVQMIEHFVPCSIVLNFSLQFKNKEHAYSTISAIVSQNLNDSVIKTHDIGYEYPLGLSMVTALYQIWKLRTSINTTVPFIEYLKRGTRRAVSYLISKDLTQTEIVIKKSGLNALGVLEFNQARPEVITKEKYPDLFTVDFVYTIQFGRPDNLRFYFPCVVENQLVPSFMIHNPPVSYVSKMVGLFQQHSLYSVLHILDKKSIFPIVFPEYDDWSVPASAISPEQYFTFFIAGVLLDTPTTTIDLTDLGDIKINDIALDIMKREGIDIFETSSIFNVSVFANDIQVDPSLLSIDENLVVTLGMTDLCKRYHLVISEVVDFSILDPQYLQTIIEYRSFFPLTVIRNMQYLIDRKYCYIDSSNQLLRLIHRSIKNLTIDAQIAQLVAAGHATETLYMYASTAEQFADYLMHNSSLDTNRLLFDEYVDLCVSLNLITEAQLPTGYIRNRRGYPLLGNTGGSGGFNTPLRILNTVVTL